MQINERAAVKAKKEIEIGAPLATVWNIHADINAWKHWHPAISAADLRGRLEVGAIFEWVSDGYKLKSTITEIDEHRILGWQGVGFGASAIHVWEFGTLENGHTLVRTSESMEGWLAKLFSGMMRKKLDASLDTWLAALKARSES